MRLALMLFWLAFAVHGADLDTALEAANKGDFATALQVWSPLADQGEAVAQYNLGVMYATGQGVHQDYKEAVKWYRLAADQGYAAAQLNLGLAHATGQGVHQDYKEAVKWYRLAAVQGDTDAQLNLGFMYYDGQGVPQDTPTAFMWHNIAAASRDKVAADLRDKLAQTMTPSQIEKGQDMTRDCVAKNYKGC